MRRKSFGHSKSQTTQSRGVIKLQEGGEGFLMWCYDAMCALANDSFLIHRIARQMMEEAKTPLMVARGEIDALKKELDSYRR